MNNVLKDGESVKLYYWMVKDLGLKGNELNVYAVIYKNTQLEKGEFDGTLRCLADWCGCTKQGVIKCLKALEAKNFIIKREYYDNKVKYCAYRVNFEMLNKNILKLIKNDI